MWRKRNSKYTLYFGLFILLLLLTAATNYIWLLYNNTPPFGDGIRPLLAGMRIYVAWHHHQSLANINSILPQEYPPLLHVLYALYFFAFGLHTGKELLINTLFLILTLISIYGLAKLLYDEKIALFAIAIFLSFSNIFQYSRFGYMEFPLMGMISFSVYSLVLTDYFSKRKYSILFGIVLGLTALTKWSFLPYIVGPFAVIARRCYIFRAAHYLRASKEIKNVFISIITASTLALFWYGVHYQAVFSRFYADNLNVSWEKFLLNRQNARIFLATMNEYVKFPFTAPWLSNFNFYYQIFCLCVVLHLFYYLYKLGTHKVQRPFAFNKTLLLSLWVLIPIVALSLPVFAGVRNYSHLLPVFPAIAIIISVSVLRIPWKFARYTLALLVVVSSIPFWNINVRLPFYNNLPPDKKVPLGVAVSFYPRAHRLLRVEWHYVSVSELQRAYLLPNHENWQHKDILRFIDEDCNPGKDTPKVLLLGDDYIVRYYQFEYYNLQMKRMVFIFEPWHAPGLLCGNVSALKDSILNSTFDYIVMKSVHLDRDNKEVEIVKAVIDFIKNDEREFKMRYKCVQQFALPDSSFMFVYKRIDA